MSPVSSGLRWHGRVYRCFFWHQELCWVFFIYLFFHSVCCSCFTGRHVFSSLHIQVVLCGHACTCQNSLLPKEKSLDRWVPYAEGSDITGGGVVRRWGVSFFFFLSIGVVLLSSSLNKTYMTVIIIATMRIVSYYIWQIFFHNFSRAHYKTEFRSSCPQQGVQKSP